MRNTLLLPRQMGKDDLNRKVLMRLIRTVLPSEHNSFFDDFLNRLDEVERKPGRKDH